MVEIWLLTMYFGLPVRFNTASLELSAVAYRNKTVSVNSRLMFYFSEGYFWRSICSMSWRREEIFPFLSENFSQEIFHIIVLFLYWIKYMVLYPVNVSVCFSWKKSNNHICSTRKLTKTGCENLTRLEKTLSNMVSGILLHVKGDGLLALMGLCRADWKMEFPFYKKLRIFQHLVLSQIRMKSLWAFFIKGIQFDISVIKWFMQKDIYVFLGIAAVFGVQSWWGTVDAYNEK